MMMMMMMMLVMIIVLMMMMTIMMKLMTMMIAKNVGLEQHDPIGNVDDAMMNQHVKDLNHCTSFQRVNEVLIDCIVISCGRAGVHRLQCTDFNLRK